MEDYVEDYDNNNNDSILILQQDTYPLLIVLKFYSGHTRVFSSSC
jgi:hypothetical protein